MQFGGGDCIKRNIIIGSILVLMIFILVGCMVSCGQSKNENQTEVKTEDVVISNPTGRYMCDDAIVILSNNGYRCTNTSMEYDEESGKYICVIEFKKIIEND